MAMDNQNDSPMSSPRRDSIPSSSLILNSPLQVDEADRRTYSSQPFVNRTFSEGEVPVAEEEIVITDYVDSQSPSPVIVERAQPVQVQSKARPVGAKTSTKSGGTTNPRICFEIRDRTVVNLSSEELWSKLSMDEVSKFYELMYALNARGSEAPSSVQTGGEDWKEHINKEGMAIPVKKLRNIIPRMLMAAYHQEEDRQGKRKLKRLWEDKPVDWPQNVPFTDPNNGEKSPDSKARTKPKQNDLVAMFNHLRARLTRGTVPFQESDDKPVVSSSTMPTSAELRSKKWFGKDNVERISIKIEAAKDVLCKMGKHKQISILAHMEDLLNKMESVNVQSAALEVECLLDTIILQTAEYPDEYMTRKLSELQSKYTGKSQVLTSHNTETKMKREVGVYHARMDMPSKDVFRMPLLKQEPLSPTSMEQSLGIKLSSRGGDIQDLQLMESILSSSVVATRPILPATRVMDMDNAYEVPKEVGKLEDDSFADVNGGRVIEPATEGDICYLQKMLDTRIEQEGRHPWDPPVKALPVPDTNLQTEQDVLDMVSDMFVEFPSMPMEYGSAVTSMPQDQVIVCDVQESVSAQMTENLAVVSEQQQEVPAQVLTSDPTASVDRVTLQSLLAAFANGGGKLSDSDDYMTKLLKMSGIPVVENSIATFGDNSAASSCGGVQQVMPPVQTVATSTMPTAVSITPTSSVPCMTTNFTPQIVMPPSFSQGQGYTYVNQQPSSMCLTEGSTGLDQSRNTMSPTSMDMILIPTMVQNMAVSSDDDDSAMPIASKRMRISESSNGKKQKK